MTNARTASSLAAGTAIAALLVTACQHDSLPPPPPGPAAVASISLAFPSPTLSMGAVQPLVPEYRDADGNAVSGVTGSWTSSNASVASVDQSGYVTGVSLGGPVAITVSKDGHSASATVSVIADRIVFRPFVATLAVNVTLQLSATPVDYSGAPIASATGPVTWSSGTPSVATVDPATGLVTTFAPGLVWIFATAAGRTGVIEIEVGNPSPYDGTWVGFVDSGQGKTSPLTFTVLIGKITSFQVTPDPGSCTATTTVSATPNTLIANAHFAFTVSVPAAGITGIFNPVTSANVTGDFSSPTAMRGFMGSLMIRNCTTSSGGNGFLQLSGGFTTATRQ